jgi:hypothetical protein
VQVPHSNSKGEWGPDREGPVAHRATLAVASSYLVPAPHVKWAAAAPGSGKFAAVPRSAQPLAVLSAASMNHACLMFLFLD